MARYLTATEILSEHKEIANVWTNRDIGYLLRLGLVRGRKLNHNIRSEFCIEDVLEQFNKRFSKTTQLK